MASGGDLSTDITCGMLVPASSVCGVEGHAPHGAAQRNVRRRVRREEENRDEDNASSESEHQLDDLA
jgi:hypothetical protein